MSKGEEFFNDDDEEATESEFKGVACTGIFLILLTLSSIAVILLLFLA